jgi:Sec-independent protein translocase protein TatA
MGNLCFAELFIVLAVVIVLLGPALIAKASKMIAQALRARRNEAGDADDGAGEKKRV